MKKTFLYVIAVILFSVSLSVASENQNTDVKALFEKKCSVCHEIERPTSMRQTRAGWEVTMNWMKSMTGADIGDDDAKLILEYLVENYGK